MAPRAPWKRQSTNGTSGDAPTKPKLGRRLSFGLKANLAAFVSELVGTFLFLFFALGGTHAVNNAEIINSNGTVAMDAAQLLYISFAFGISLMVNVWAFFRIGGGMFNPAVAIAMFAAGGINFVRLVLVVIAQLAGSLAAAGLAHGLMPGRGFYATTTLNSSITVTQAFFLELFLTAQLVFAIFMLVVEKHRSTSVGCIGVGMALFIAQMAGVYYTGGSLNPARSFGPAVVTMEFPSYHWIYWIGPILGALLATAFYKLVKALEFDLVNPDIDTPPPRTATKSITEGAKSNELTHDHGGVA
ncbi:unnamed protein product [Discula destructiva]